LKPVGQLFKKTTKIDSFINPPDLLKDKKKVEKLGTIIPVKCLKLDDSELSFIFPKTLNQKNILKPKVGNAGSIKEGISMLISREKGLKTLCVT